MRFEYVCSVVIRRIIVRKMVDNRRAGVALYHLSDGRRIKNERFDEVKLEHT
jgi:hypothetical protein